MRFLYGEPAAVLGNWLIISDLHIGAGRGLRWSILAHMVSELAEKTRKRKVMVLGDVKDSVVGTDGDAGLFIREIGSRYDLHVVKGNHDGGIEKYERHCTVHGPEGVRVGSVWLMHGHAWPAEQVLECEKIVIGHIHPRRGKDRVWLVGEIDRGALAKRYGRSEEGRIGIVCMPAFSEPRGAGTGLGMERSPLLKGDTFIKSTVQIYLLNGIRIE